MYIFPPYIDLFVVRQSAIFPSGIIRISLLRGGWNLRISMAIKR
jgi:hypothetical protein